MKYNTDRVDEVVLALVYLTLRDDVRSWKRLDWDALKRLHEKGMIGEPVSKAKSVVLTEEGLAESEGLFWHYLRHRTARLTKACRGRRAVHEFSASGFGVRPAPLKLGR